MSKDYENGGGGNSNFDIKIGGKLKKFPYL